MTQRQTILLVDHEEPFQRITVKALTTLGCRIVTSNLAADVIDTAYRERPDLIMLDAELPGTSGIELCRRIVGDQNLKSIPVMLLSSNHDFNLRLDGLNAGAVDFVMKPFLMAELQARVKTQLRMRSLNQEMLNVHQSLAEKERAESIHVFAIGIGHNFNNLLTAGLGFLSLALEETEDKGILGYLRNIDLALKRMCTLARQLLAFTGDLVTVKRPVAIHRLFTNALAIFDPAALSSKIAIICDISGLGDTMVTCDEFRLTQAFLHVMNNARESLKPKGGRIFVNGYVEGKSVIITIRDLGAGMSAETLEHSLEPFYTTSNEVGKGLGLCMVDGIIRDLGGKLELSSIEGEGTSVRLTIPVAKAEVSSDEIITGDFEPGIRILVAVDVEETSQALQAVLVSNRFNVESVDTYDELLSKLSGDPDRYGAIVVDLLRSDYFGDRMMEEIRAYTDLPVIYLVSTPKEAPSDQAALQILHKPFDTEALLGVLRKFPRLVRYS
ncbi:MAG: response regulator [Planctomycetes bacterium]|nr:response regulator [Planctomycetota bacterium]